MHGNLVGPLDLRQQRRCQRLPVGGPGVADTLAENLTSCNKTAWRTRPIAQTGAILATSRGAVARIVQKDTFVRVYQVPTTDGPPPVDVLCR